MDWKQALEIEDSRWLGIGKYLADITKASLAKENKTACDLTNHLREIGNQHIEPAYVDEYLSGNASFGCFFPQIRDFLGISANDVFRNVSEDQAQTYLKSLDEYLLDIDNVDSLVIFSKYKPGKELREYVRDFLTELRKEKLEKPYQSFTVGLDVEPKEFDDLLLGTIQKSTKVKELSESSNVLQTPPTKVPNLEIMVAPGNSDFEDLRKSLIKNINDKVKSGWTRYHFINEDSTLKIMPSYSRGKAGLTLDFYKSGQQVDRDISGMSYLDDLEEMMPQAKARFRRQFIDFDAWKEAYTNGTFSTIEDDQQIANMIAHLDSGVDALVPTREPTPAERYEVHQRWVWGGGAYMPGQHVKGPGEVERMMNNKPDPVGRSEFEETAYKINSYLTISLGLFHKLKELVEDKPLLIDTPKN